ncbi:MAG: DUF1684 domain-containing protein [Chloroflexota bacterium]|nr:DUF1684 domain-containing protein [Chloroflexota bacterium]
MSDEYITLLDWRRRVADLYSAVRAKLTADAPAAHALWRSTRDELFRAHPQSPIPPAERDSFRGLPYYDYDPRFAKRGKVRSLPEERHDVGTSTGGVIPFVRFGAVDLDVGSLEVFWLDAYSGGVFLPFRDATAGKTTYGGGRYLLDTAKSADLGGIGDELVLDFNFAYHPSCRYDPKWVCPLAPLGNRLQVAIEAGERM